MKLTQSVAIMYYIGRKNNMIGRTDEEKMYVDMLVNQAMDMRMRYAYLVYDSDYVSTVQFRSIWIACMNRGNRNLGKRDSIYHLVLLHCFIVSCLPVPSVALLTLSHIFPELVSYSFMPCYLPDLV